MPAHAPLTHAQGAGIVRDLMADLAGQPRALQVLRELVHAHTSPNKANTGDDLERYTSQCLHYIGFALDKHSHPAAPEAGNRMLQLREALGALEGPLRLETQGMGAGFASRIRASQSEQPGFMLGRS
ncbi:MAG: hypothetical protein DI582_09550 [Azospirillum brasilense]|nr:MAG: hypothetical protein DI582_09550 [Azospirillum brasilense]